MITNKVFQRLLSVLLFACMLLSLLPGTAFAWAGIGYDAAASVPFSREAEENQKVFFDVVSVTPGYSISTSTLTVSPSSIDGSTSDPHHLFCRFLTEDGNKAWLFLSASEYYRDFNSEADLADNTASTVFFREPTRIYGEMRLTDDVCYLEWSYIPMSEKIDSSLVVVYTGMEGLPQDTSAEYTDGDFHVLVSGREMKITGTGALKDLNDLVEDWDTIKHGIRSIEIEEGITSIGDYVFSKCYSLMNVTLPEGVTSIGEGAFSDCAALRDITLPETVTSIGDEAFCRCDSLVRMKFPEGVTSIGNRMFSGSSCLMDVMIPEGVTSIGESAFSGCDSLTSITIPNGVSVIGNGAFFGCSNLQSLIIPDTVKSIGSGAFYLCDRLKNIGYTGTIEEWMKIEIGEEAIPDSVSLSCSADPAFGPFCVMLLGDTLFITGNGEVEDPYDLVEDWYSVDSGIACIVIGEGVTSIGNYAFSDCENLKSVTIASNSLSIGNYAFSDCSSLADVLISGRVISIGSHAFSKCSSLTGIMIPEGVTSIGDYAFSECSSLTGITIPEGVTSIGSHAFSECSSLTGITIPESVTSIGEGAFSYCDSLVELKIPASVNSIGDYAFYSKKLKTIIYAGTKEQWTAIDGVENAVSKGVSISFLG